MRPAVERKLREAVGAGLHDVALGPELRESEARRLTAEVRAAIEERRAELRMDYGPRVL